jgi:hypothetical protein
LELEVPKRHVLEQTINHFTEDSKYHGPSPPSQPLSPSRQPQVIYIYIYIYIYLYL